jgi:putative hydrolase of the HAD superfamily
VKALIFDFGGPVLLTPFELRAVGEESMGVPAGSLAWTGPFDPDADPQWRAFQSGEMTEREYWAIQAEKFAQLTGEPATMPALMGHLYDGSPEQLLRPGAVALIRDAKAAGIPVGLLTNDLTTFHDADWVARMTILEEFDCVVDGRADGVMKPNAAAYELICNRMGFAPEDCVFIDDQVVNLDGAEAVGLIGVYLDPTDPEPAYAKARILLGLT